MSTMDQVALYNVNMGKEINHLILLLPAILWHLVFLSISLLVWFVGFSQVVCSCSEQLFSVTNPLYVTCSASNSRCFSQCLVETKLRVLKYTA